MWTPWNTNNRNILGRYRQLTGGGCTNDFVKFKYKIEGEIAQLNEKKPREFCQKCSNLRTTIINKDTEFKACSTQQSKQLKLIEDYDIKNFIDKCPTVPECLQMLLQRNKKPVAAKQESKTNCVKNKGCEQTISSTASQKANPPPRSASETSSTGITQGKKPQNLSGPHDNREISSAGDPALQTLQNVRDPSKSSEPEGEISKNEANDQSNTHVQVETETPFPSPVPSEARELSTGQTDHPSHRSSDQDSQSGDIFQVTDLHNKTLQHNVPDGQGSGGSTPREQAPAGESIGNQAHNDQSVTTGTSGDSTPAQIPPVNERQGDEKSIFGTVNSTGTENTAIDGGGTDKKNLCNEVTDYQSSNNGSLCSKEQHNELMDNNTNALGIFSNIFGVIQANKDNVINTSIPVGIVLLLGLLFKYTPLWSFLTKRKRKKQSHMNEKLQRVLQQPSSGSETRSIPFSYSAFEYSSE
ncbi:hypothetical protein PVIIG_01604 [Plasmodium vivax India VII]|uniref:Variable surface protein Vir18 n=1 Tax=Plasmodium vivax India VII TaxID=1077284 RepID=A0A0J9S853_PLAVI|nr:hypothetical protein PVIIG_01604 [Plasmodium vivax India VII]